MVSEYMRELISDIDSAIVPSSEGEQMWLMRQELMRRLIGSADMFTSGKVGLIYTTPAPSISLEELLRSMTHDDWYRVAGRIMDDIEEEARNEREGVK